MAERFEGSGVPAVNADRISDCTCLVCNRPVSRVAFIIECQHDVLCEGCHAWARGYFVECIKMYAGDQPVSHG